MRKMLCDKCGAEVATDLTPAGWNRYAGKDLCESCARKLLDLEEALNQERDEKIQVWLNRQ